MEISTVSAFIQNLSEKKKQFAIGAASMLAGSAILIGYFQSGPNALSYAKAETAFAAWEASPLDEALYQSMKEAMKGVPALEKKYEATIAQTLLNTDKIDEAVAMAGRPLDRLQGEAPFHTAYAKTSLLIEQGSFQQALEDAVALKEQMGPSYFSENKGGAVLYAYNLLRIACLQQELKNRPGEKAAWEELESLLQTKTPMASALLVNFSEKQLDLTQYIAERKKVL